jgi:hypothetical protein
MEQINNGTYCIDKPLNDKILEEIKNYSEISFGDKFNQTVKSISNCIKIT